MSIVDKMIEIRSKISELFVELTECESNLIGAEFEYNGGAEATISFVDRGQVLVTFENEEDEEIEEWISLEELNNYI